MNERIQKLAEQAGLEGSNGHYEYDWFDPEKYTELLIEEVHYLIVVGGVENLDIVLEHFGVEK